MGRIICELERIYGVRQGSAYKKADTAMLSQKTQSDLQKELNIDRDKYAKYKRLTTLIPEFQEMEDQN